MLTTISHLGKYGHSLYSFFQFFCKFELFSKKSLKNKRARQLYNQDLSSLKNI